MERSQRRKLVELDKAQIQIKRCIMICVSTLEVEGGGEMLQDTVFTVYTLADRGEQVVECINKWRAISGLKLRI